MSCARGGRSTRESPGRPRAARTDCAAHTPRMLSTPPTPRAPRERPGAPTRSPPPPTADTRAAGRRTHGFDPNNSRIFALCVSSFSFHSSYGTTIDGAKLSSHARYVNHTKLGSSRGACSLHSTAGVGGAHTRAAPCIAEVHLVADATSYRSQVPLQDVFLHA